MKQQKQNLTAVCFCLILGCGYAPVRKPGHSIRVAAVKTDTAQAEAGGIIAAAMRSELAGRRRLAADGSSAPELHVELMAIHATPSAAGG